MKEKLHHWQGQCLLTTPIKTIASLFFLIVFTFTCRYSIAGPFKGVYALPVSGKITNERNEPLSGVSVAEKGTNNGTVTKEDGTYTLTVNDANATLVLTYVGNATQEVKVNGQGTVKVQLQPNANDLNAVVLIGYQTVRKRDLTGSTGVVN